MKRNLDDIIKSCQNLKQKDLTLVKMAFKFAQKAHQGQKRKNQDDFIQHPIHAAVTLAKIGLDAETIAAALLHDTVEDAGIKSSQIQQNFGDQIADLVGGVTNLSKIRLKKNLTCLKHDDRTESQIENLRKMFVAMAKDLRVILIKLADRLHNVQTLYALPPQTAKKIARETLEIYAPLAHRLGIGEIKGQLEDLAFPYVFPKEYRWTKSLVGQKYQDKKQIVQKMIKILKKELDKEKVPYFDIHGRTKHLFSLYKKLVKFDKDISKMYDLMAVRVITDSPADCYKILGFIHQIWKPLPGYIKDFISMPKPNGYQSLHTTVFAPEGQICEIQIRTRQMHYQAEFGVAAHWHYKTKYFSPDEKNAKLPSKEFKWIAELAKWQEKIKNPQEFKDTLKLDFFSDRIFAFTPQGDVKNLPQFATPIDFAYSVHSQIGDHCSGAKVGGKMVPLNYELKNGDIVEIIVAKSANPRPDWLKNVKTAEARSRIRNFLKTKGLI